jgi:hypothetical protein
VEVIILCVRGETEKLWRFSNVTGYGLVVWDLIFIGGFVISFHYNIKNIFLPLELSRRLFELLLSGIDSSVWILGYERVAIYLCKSSI